MDTAHSIDLGLIAHELHLPLDRVQRTVELLDDGNTVPFITRYRRERTGGLDEEQIRWIAEAVKRRRQLLERKQSILKIIESQGKLTPELQREIEQAQNLKRLEDLYLPYKQKKQSLAVQARQRGLEPLALAILNGEQFDLAVRAAEAVDAEKELPSVAEVLTGLGHIAAEAISERADLRGRLRRIFFRTGRLVSTKIEKPPEAEEAAPTMPAAARVVSDESAAEEATSESPDAVESSLASSDKESETSRGDVHGEDPTVMDEAEASDASSDEEDETEDETASEEAVAATTSDTSETPAAETPASETNGPVLPVGRMFEKPVAPVLAPVEKKKKKKKKKKLTDNAFKDYFNFQEPLAKLPPHRTLAINRGERANVLRIKIDSDFDALLREAEEVVIPPQHPHADFLRGALRDALTRLIVPSLEREARRELSERAEQHAVEVFIRNLRKLLLQPPVQGRRVLAIDPGFKSGCKMAAIDEWGNTLAHGMFFIIGKDDRKEKARQRIGDMIRQHKLSVIAIGNGTACRETELLVADMLADELKDSDVAYVTVNEAGASVYSTSPLGREELPGYDAILRSAVSIGRRLLDPLSELVKINPANIGVGMYQHDMKAKHLKESLDGVVESCVNFVGVDVNSASPALLRYVSGLNALTARRIYEHRREHGPFRNREDLKKVPGIGEATFVQAAGFLKILGGDNPLDATWIHPESYPLAKSVLERFQSSVEELAQAVPAPPIPPAQPELPRFGEGIVPVAPAEAATTEAAPVATEAPANNVEAPIADAAPVEAPSAEANAEPTESTPAAVETPVAETPATEQPTPVAEAPTAVEPPAPPKVNPIAEKLANVNIAQSATEMSVSPLLLEDIVFSLTRPGRDPREELPPPVFRRGIMKLEDLQAGMEIQGTVLNVVDFGAFVDIGLTDSGLVHISRLADRFIRDPHEVVGVGDVLKLWVTDVDRARRRVSLTAIQPGTERPPQPRREERQPRPQQDRPRPQQQRPPRSNDGPPREGQGGQQQRSNAPPAGDRPPRQGNEGGGGGRRDQQQRGGPRRPQGAPQQQNQGPRVVERPPSKPKVVKPITKAMEEGKEAMRSFSDLLQFLGKKSDGDEGKKKK